MLAGNTESYFLEGVEKKGFCVDSNGKDQNKRTYKIGTVYSKEQCWDMCKQNLQAKGCEYYYNRDCWIHLEDVANGNGKDHYSCLVLKKKAGKCYRTSLDFMS